MEKKELEAKLNRIEKVLKKLEEHFTAHLNTVEWLSEDAFRDRTKYKTKEQLRNFRKNNPNLWKARKSYTVERNEKTHTINRDFMYNYTEYMKSFSKAA